MLTRIGAAALIILTPASAWAGDLVFVGGSWQWPATGDPYGISIYQEIVELAGGPEAAKIGILTTASSSAQSAQENGSLYVEDFQDLYQEYYPNREPDVEWIPLQIDNCSTAKNDPAIARQIISRNAFVFGGGDQSLITECFFNENSATETRTTTPVFEALKNNSNAVIAGTSAGTSVQTGVPMITEGESYEAILKGANALVGSPPFVPELYYNPLGGFGFFPYGLTDTHFSARGRQGRTIRLAADLDVPMVFGIDENTALVVRDVGNQAEMTVLGEQGVSIFDLSEATVNEDDWSISNVSMTYLTAGDRYDPLTKTATFPQKTPAACAGETIPTSADIFSAAATGDRPNPREFINVALDLAASCATTATGRSAQTDPFVQVTMSDESATSYLGYDSQGIKKQSFVNLTVDIKREVPEPSTVGMIGMGILGMLWRRRCP